VVNNYDSHARQSGGSVTASLQLRYPSNAGSLQLQNLQHAIPPPDTTTATLPGKENRRRLARVMRRSKGEMEKENE